MSTTNLYLPSKNVSVFPFSSPRVADPASHILNEKNITRLVQKLTDYSSYVVSFEPDGPDYHMEFVIEGYYYDVRIPQNKLYNDTNIYAQVEIIEDDLGYKYLSGGDYTEFDGGDGTIASLYTVQKGVSTFLVPTEGAWFKFELKATEFVTITTSLTTAELYCDNPTSKIYSSNNYCDVEGLSTNEVTVTARQNFALLVYVTCPEGVTSGGITFTSEGEVNTLFTGVKLVSSEQVSSPHALHILTVDNTGNATVPVESLHRIKPPALHIDRIVCEI